MKRAFSRWMPPLADRSPSIAVYAVLLVLIGLTISWAALDWPRGIIVIALFLTICFIGNRLDRRRLRRLAECRGGEHIGCFALAFDRRAPHFDPWVIRATWDALQPYVRFNGGSLPLRPDDMLESNLQIDSEDIADLVFEVLERAGRSCQALEANPYYSRIRTVGDIVLFAVYQPCLTRRIDSPERGSPGTHPVA